MVNMMLNKFELLTKLVTRAAGNHHHTQPDSGHTDLDSDSWKA